MLFLLVTLSIELSVCETICTLSVLIQQRFLLQRILFNKLQLLQAIKRKYYNLVE